MDLVSMTCRSCGGKLQISQDMEQIICQNCGTEYLVTTTGSSISIKLLSEGLKQIQISTDKTASELALVRLKEEIPELEYQIPRLAFKFHYGEYYKFLSSYLLKDLPFLEKFLYAANDLDRRISKLTRREWKEIYEYYSLQKPNQKINEFLRFLQTYIESLNLLEEKTKMLTFHEKQVNQV